MSALVVWLDSREAKIFDLKPEGVETRHFKAHGHKHPKEPHGHHAESKDQLAPFFEELAGMLGTPTELLILGPGEAKVLFKGHLDSHHKGLAKSVVAVETTDHPSEKQILELTRKFFKKYDAAH